MDTDEMIAVLRDRRQELTYRISEIDACLTLLGVSPEEDAGDDQRDEEPEGSPTPRGKAARPKPSRNGHANGKGHAVRVARLLDAEGPLTPSEVARRLEIPKLSANRSLLDSPWFEKTGKGLRDPYQLTEEGRKALQGLPAE